MAVEESVIRRVRVSWWLQLTPALAIGAAGVWLWRDGRVPVASAALGVATLLAADWWLRSTTLTSRRLLVRSGPLGLRRREFDPNRTGQIDVVRGRFGRLLDFGDVIVHPVESEAVLVRLRNVGDPEAMQELIREVRMNSASYVIGF
ncbi:MAG TPA: PH domain-containing protein [Planctomycetota bacterium]|nr:PH domain-containing protein [Planctomycetota bacterium]